MTAAPPSLPLVLAGPILRRTTTTEVSVWVATSAACRARVEVSANGSVLATGEGDTVSLGERLFVHLATARPTEPLPTGKLLSYDLVVDGRRLADLDLPGGVASIAYAGTLPGFVLPDEDVDLTVLHGSCRLLHGHGDDALAFADTVLANTHDDATRRPQALLLTGDQIYGDEVGGPIARHLSALGRALVDDGDPRSVPGIDDLDAIPLYGRQQLCEDVAGFTSHKAANHLLSAGEFAAAHLVSWNEALWPPEFAPAPTWLSKRLRRRYADEAASLDAARRALPAVRRVLANVPTYMCFDDHDVTDDWNLTRRWVERVKASPTGRTVVTNALAAYWAFQGWGNQPDAFDGHLTDEASLWAFDRWSFVVPTTPPVVVLDTRMHRGFDSDEGAARLVDERELERVAGLCRDAVRRGGQPLVLVSPTPVFGLELQERRQKYLSRRLDPYEIDFEAWHSNLAGFTDFMRMLIDDVGVTRCVVLSGDVHYGLNVDVEFSHDGRELRLAQLVSSSLKHSGGVARSLLHALGRAVRPEHARLGWDAPPVLNARPAIARTVDRLLQRSVNTDEWRDDAPVFLRESLADRVDGEPSRYRERRRYVGPEERPRSFVIGANNIGLVTLEAGCVRHELIVGTNGRNRTSWTAAIDLREEGPRAG